MKRLTVLILCCLCLSLSITAYAQNLLTNAGFENGSSGWTMGAQANAAVKHSSQVPSGVSAPHSGNGFILAYNTVGSGNPWGYCAQRVSSGFAVGDRLRLTGYFKTKGPTFVAGSPTVWVRLWVNFINTAGTVISTKSSSTLSAQFDWKQIDLPFVVPANTAKVEVSLEARVTDLFNPSEGVYQYAAWDDAVLVKDDNVVGDPSFEAARKGAWYSWSTQGLQPAADWTTAADLGFSGAKDGDNYLVAQKLKGTAPDDTTTGVYGWKKQTFTGATALTPGDYEVSIWVKRGGPGGVNWTNPNQWVRFSVPMTDSSGISIYPYPSMQTNVTSNIWTKLAVPFTVPANAATTTFTLEFKMMDQSATSWFCIDQVCLRKINYVEHATMSDLRNLPDGAAVKLVNKIVTRSWTRKFYIEESDRSFGIGVVLHQSDSTVFSPNQLIVVYGELGTVNNERIINCTAYETNGFADEPIKPVGLNGSSASAGERSSVNMISNSAFENGKTLWITGATTGCKIDHNADVVDAPVSNAHSPFGYIIQYRDTSDPGTVYGRTFQQMGSVAPGNYLASAWVYTGGNGSSWGTGSQYAQVAVVLKASGLSDITILSDKVDTATNGWVQLGVPFTVPPDYKTIELNLHGYLANNYPSAYLCFDDAKVAPLALPSGLSADGLLVRVWGKVLSYTESDYVRPAWMLIDDGSGLLTRIEITDPYILLSDKNITYGSMVTATGVSGGIGLTGALTVRVTSTDDF